jgi:acyl-CoA synthetase (NDP forming)
LRVDYVPMAMLDDFRLLERYGFKLLPYKLAASEDEAAAAAKRIGYPVALKIVSEEISHKSDIGGVKVKIRDEAALRLAYKEIMDNVKGHKVDGILVQKMARKGIELIIGGKKDPQFGHMIVLGLGGIYVEIFRDVTARICPVTDDDVKEMVEELKSHPLLEGARGAKPIDMKALRGMVLGVCKFIMEEDIKEIDLNPVVFDENGGDIVDVRFTR